MRPVTKIFYGVKRQNFTVSIVPLQRRANRGMLRRKKDLFASNRAEVLKDLGLFRPAADPIRTLRAATPLDSPHHQIRWP